jgi:hypothetical protein
MRCGGSVFIVTVLAVVFSPDATAQCKDSVVGTWKLVSVKATTDKGDVDIYRDLRVAKTTEKLAAMFCNVLLKRQSGLFGLHASIICDPAKPIVFLFGRCSDVPPKLRNRLRKRRGSRFILRCQADFRFTIHAASQCDFTVNTFSAGSVFPPKHPYEECQWFRSARSPIGDQWLGIDH